MKKLTLRLITIILLTLSLSSAYAQPFFRDIIVTSPDAIWTDSRAYSTLNDAVAAVGANERVIKIVTPQVVTDLTVPSNVTLEFERDGAINHSGTLTLNTKKIRAPDRQIFISSGDIIFTDGTVVRSSWFKDLPEAIKQTNSATERVTLVVTEESIINEDVALGNHTILKWEAPYNCITINEGFTLSNIKNIEAGNYQLFTGSGNFDFLDGIELNLTWLNTLSEALTWIGTAEVTLAVNDSITISTNETVNSNIVLKIKKGAIINLDAGTILEIYSPANIESPEGYRSLLGSGIVVFTRRMLISEWLIDNNRGETGKRIFMEGFWEPGDGGGGWFYWSWTEPRNNHDGGTIIYPSHPETPGTVNWYSYAGGGNGCWIREGIEGQYWAEWFGAVGDGVTEDYYALNAIVQKAVKRNVSGPDPTTLYLPKHYNIGDNTITVDWVTNMHLNGLGTGEIDCDTNGAMFYFTTGLGWSSFTNFKALRNSNKTTGSYIIQNDDDRLFAGVKFRNVSFYGGDVNIRFRGHANYFEQCNFSEAGSLAIEVYPGGAGSTSGTSSRINTFNSCAFHVSVAPDYTQYSVHIQNTTGRSDFLFQGCYFEGGGYGIGSFFLIEGFHNITINSCYFAFIDYTGIGNPTTVFGIVDARGGDQCIVKIKNTSIYIVGLAEAYVSIMTKIRTDYPFGCKTPGIIFIDSTPMLKSQLSVNAESFQNQGFKLARGAAHIINTDYISELELLNADFTDGGAGVVTSWDRVSTQWPNLLDPSNTGLTTLGNIPEVNPNTISKVIEQDIDATQVIQQALRFKPNTFYMVRVWVGIEDGTDVGLPYVRIVYNDGETNYIARTWSFANADKLKDKWREVFCIFYFEEDEEYGGSIVDFNNDFYLRLGRFSGDYAAYFYRPRLYKVADIDIFKFINQDGTI